MRDSESQVGLSWLRRAPRAAWSEFGAALRDMVPQAHYRSSQHAPPITIPKEAAMPAKG